MRVVHVISRLDPADGGPPAALLRLACAQSAIGAMPTLVAMGSHGQIERVAQAFAHLPNYRKLGIRLLRGQRVLNGFPDKRAEAELADAISTADVVHLHGMWQPVLLRAAIIARNLTVPYAVSPHGMLSRWSMQQKRLKKQLALRLIWRQILGDAAFIQTLNEDERAHIAPLRLPAAEVVIGNGVDPAELADVDERVELPHGLGGRKYILFLGRLHYSKGLDVLAEAFAGLSAARPDLHLVVVGPDFGYERNFRRRVRDLGIANRVHVLGPLYGRDKLAVLRAAECFCLPSRQEGFSMALLEAMAVGLPVVISDACHFPEAAVGGVVVPVDADAVHRALHAVCSDADYRSRLAAAGRALVQDRYTWPAISRQTVDAYRRHCTPSTDPARVARDRIRTTESR